MQSERDCYCVDGKSMQCPWSWKSTPMKPKLPHFSITHSPSQSPINNPPNHWLLLHRVHPYYHWWVSTQYVRNLPYMDGNWISHLWPWKSTPNAVQIAIFQPNTLTFIIVNRRHNYQLLLQPIHPYYHWWVSMKSGRDCYCMDGNSIPYPWPWKSTLRVPKLPYFTLTYYPFWSPIDAQITGFCCDALAHTQEQTVQALALWTNLLKK